MSGAEKLADRYELLGRLGEGGMGVVWRARDTRLNRTVAVKVLPPSAVGNAIARARLLREARAAAGLDHEGIIHVYDVGETPDGGAFLVMELVRGKSLRDLLEEGSLTVDRKIAAIVAAARALGFAHAAGIVHRDVKPDNIMVRDDGRVAVVDFGVAKPVAASLLDDAASAETVPQVKERSLTREGQLVGTPAYLAPEQARGQEVSAATDQFALAVTTYEALTGRLPWRGEGALEVVAAILRDPPPKLDDPSFPAALGAVLERALAKAPTERFESMSAFADALGEAMGRVVVERPSAGVPVSGNANTVPDLVLPELRTTGMNAAKTPAPDARATPSRKPLFVVGALAVAAAAFAGLATRRAPPPAAASSTFTGPIACPPFVVAGIDAPWLGGAVATLACERVQLRRGGLDDRTITPAELLGAPRDVTQKTPPELFEDAGAHEHGVDRAQALHARWIDGKLEKQAAEYMVRLELKDGSRVLASGEGHSIEIFEAVRDAFEPLLDEIPPTAEEEKTSSTWLDVDSHADASALLDLRTALLIEDPVALKGACAKAANRSTLRPRVRYLAKLMCARRLRTGPVGEPPPAIDDSTPGAWITTMLAQGTAGGPSEVRARAERLEQRAAQTSSVEGQARLLAAAADTYNLVNDEHAGTLARRSLQISPKAVDWRASAWHRLAFSSEGDNVVGQALGTWQPWEPISQSLRTDRRTLSELTTATDAVRRGYLLSQRGFYAHLYGDQLLANGEIDLAENVAERTDDDLLRVALLVAKARYGAALTTVTRLLAQLPANEESAAKAFLLAHLGVRASLVLGKTPDFVGPVVDKYVMSEPHHVVDGVVPFASLVTICCFAPTDVGQRCTERLQSLQRDGKLPTIFNGAETVLAGAARFVAGDYPGASRAWRTMLRSAGWIQDPVRDIMAVAFDRSDMVELAEEIDGPSVAAVDLPRPAELAWVRAAKRAEKRGDRERARKLARAVVDKWRFADEDVPSVREMQQLLARLPP